MFRFQPNGGLWVVLMLILAAGFLTGSAQAENVLTYTCDAPQASTDSSSNWVFMPGPFSHNPYTGERIVQYAPKAPALRNPNAWFESPGPGMVHATLIQETGGPYDAYNHESTRVIYQRHQHFGNDGHGWHHGHHGYHGWGY